MANLLALGSWEAIEDGLAQVAEEALRFFVAHHPARKAAELAEAFLAGVCWAISEETGWWFTAEFQDLALLKGARRIGGKVEKIVSSHISAEKLVAEADREMIRAEIAREKGVRPEEVCPEDFRKFWADALRQAIREIDEIP